MVQSEAERRSDVVKMVGVAGHQLRRKLGEPRALVEKFDQPVELSGSASPEALHALRMAKRADWSQGASAAIPYMQRAIELDPQYAEALGYLGYYYSDVGESELAAQAITKAYQLRDRLGVDSHFRFALETNYFWIATGELEKALDVASRQLQAYPNSATATANIGAILLSMGELARAVPPLEAQVSTTMNRYGTALMNEKRKANASVVRMVMRNQAVCSDHDEAVGFCEGDAPSANDYESYKS